MTITKSIIAALALSAAPAFAQNLYSETNITSYNGVIEGQALARGDLNGTKLTAAEAYIAGFTNATLDANIITESQFNYNNFFLPEYTIYLTGFTTVLVSDTWGNIYSPTEKVVVNQGVTLYGSIYAEEIVLMEGARVVEGEPLCGCPTSNVPETGGWLMGIGLAALGFFADFRNLKAAQDVKI